MQTDEHPRDVADLSQKATPIRRMRYIRQSGKLVHRPWVQRCAFRVMKRTGPRRQRWVFGTPFESVMAGRY